METEQKRGYRVEMDLSMVKGREEKNLMASGVGSIFPSRGLEGGWQACYPGVGKGREGPCQAGREGAGYYTGSHLFQHGLGRLTSSVPSVSRTPS